MPDSFAAARTYSVQGLIPRPPADVSSLRAAFSKIVASQWQRHVPPVLGDAPLGASREQTAKVRFIAGMYARACYSMLLVSAHGPLLLRSPIRIATILLNNRRTAVRFGCSLLSLLNHLVPRSVHRQIALMATLMGAMDIVLDEAALSGHDSVLRVASMLSSQPQAMTNPLEATLAKLAQAIRVRESQWQTDFWDQVLLPVVQEYCSEEALAVANVPDPTGLGHRWAGVEAAIKGMWYAVGRGMGLDKTLAGFQRPHWNREQQWMGNASLLVQMIDDWIDQDKDRGVRSTPVTSGAWNPQTIQELYSRTMTELARVLEERGMQNKVFKDLFTDLYADYLYAAIEAMESGLAA